MIRSTFFQSIGLRTYCCNAKVVAWHHDKFICATCKNPVTKASREAGRAALPAYKRLRLGFIHRTHTRHLL